MSEKVSKEEVQIELAKRVSGIMKFAARHHDSIKNSEEYFRIEAKRCLSYLLIGNCGEDMKLKVTGRFE